MGIVLASANSNKLSEINAISQSSGVIFELPKGEFNPIENGKTFASNAYIKAFEAAKLTGKIAMADDTGLCVDKLNGAPGLYSARYAPTPEEKIDKILKELKDVPLEDRTANFTCSMMLVNSDGDILYSAEGKINGIITFEPAGVNGFGYDPIFFIPEYNKTMAEISEAQKNTISHRALALAKMLKFIQKNRLND